MKLNLRPVVLLCAACLGGGCAATFEGTKDPVSGPSAVTCLPVVQDGVRKQSAQQNLGAMLDEVAALAHQGESRLRDALAAYDAQVPCGDRGRTLPLRRALILASIGEQGDETEVLTLLDTHGESPETPAAEALLARLLAEQIRARRTLRARLAETREARDALAGQLEELKAIEQQIRDRTNTSADIQLQQKPE